MYRHTDGMIISWPDAFSLSMEIRLRNGYKALRRIQREDNKEDTKWTERRGPEDSRRWANLCDFL
jgi:hypothetical protein